MPCHCRSILSAFNPTMSTEGQRTISSVYRQEMEAWSDIVVYTQEPHELPVWQNLERFMIHPILGKGLRFQVPCRSPSGETCSHPGAAGFSRQHCAHGAELSGHNQLALPPPLPSATTATERRDTRDSFRSDSHCSSCYKHELPEHISTIRNNASRLGENSFSIACIKIFIYQCKALLWTTFGVIYMKSILINNLLKDVLIINC